MKRLAAALFAAVVLMSACGSSSDSSADAVPTPASAAATSAAAPTFVGKVEGTDAFVAVVDAPGETFAYLCDSAQLWTHLTATGEADAFADDDGVRLTLTREGDQVSGSVTLADGSAHAFTASKAAGAAGYYSRTEIEDDTASLGHWIQLADGSVRGKVVTVTEGADGGAPEPEPDGNPTVVTTPPQPDGAIKCAIAAVRMERAAKAAKEKATMENIQAYADARNAARAACR